MKVNYHIILAWGMLLPLSAQTLKAPKEEKIISDEVQNAIDEFNRVKSEGKEKQNEDSIALPPPASVEVREEPLATPADEVEKEKPILVSGKHPENPADISAEETEETVVTKNILDKISEATAPAPASEANEHGLEIRVESIRKGTGILDPANINLRASFPAKPLANPPPGWRFEKSKDAPAITREVEIQPGTVISLDIKPHILIPDADGANIFAVNEPGYDSLEGYRQKQTVSAILAKSVVQLDEDVKQLGSVLSELNRILASMPQPETKKLPVEEVKQ